MFQKPFCFVTFIRKCFKLQFFTAFTQRYHWTTAARVTSNLFNNIDMCNKAYLYRIKHNHTEVRNKKKYINTIRQLLQYLLSVI